MPAAAALAVILITAGFIMRTTPGSRSDSPGVVPAEAALPPQQDAEPAEPAVAGADPWVVQREALIIDEAPGIVAGGRAPVLAYIDQPKRSPDPERLIQTEVLVRSGTVARAWGAMRLALSLLALGAALGFGLIGFVRALVWVFSSA